MIDPNNTNTIRTGELPNEPFSINSKIPHELGTDLKNGTGQQLADFIASIIEVTGGVGFRAVSVTDGQTLPTTTEQEFILVGKGTYFNVAGGDTIVLTEELNALVSNGSFWFVGVEIPINVELAGITQEVREGFLTTTPSEDAVFKFIQNLDLATITGLTNNTIPVFKDGNLQDSTFSLDKTYASPGNPLEDFNFRNVIKGNDNGFTNPLNFAMAINDNIDRPIYAFGNSGRFNVYDYTGNGGTAVLYNLADVPMFYVGHYAFAGKNSNGKVNTTNIVGAKIINNTASAMSSAIELQYMTDADTSTEHAQPNQVVQFSKDGFKLPNIPIVPDSGTQMVTGNLTTTNFLTSQSSVRVVKAGSNTIGEGANVNFIASAQNRQYFMQLNASGGIDHHFFNGSTFVSPSSLSNTGILRLSTLAGTGQRVVTANASGELSNTSPESFIVRAAGSDTPAGGTRYSLSNLASTQIAISQLSASGGVDYYVFNGSAFVKYLGVTNLGAVSFGTTVTVPNATLAGQAVNKGQLDLKADLASPALTGVPTAPTATAGTNTTQIANTVFVNSAITTADAGNVKTTGNQTIAGRKSMVSSNATLSGLTLTNTRTTNTGGTSDSAIIEVINSGTAGISVNSTSGSAINASNNTGTVISLGKTSSAIGLNINDFDASGTGDVIRYVRNNVELFRVLPTGQPIAPNATALNHLVTKAQTLYTNQTITANKTVTIAEFVNNNELILSVNATSGNITITLPTFTALQGYKVTVKKMDSSANSVLITGVGGINIDGASTLIISGQYGTATVGANLSQYIIL